MNDRFVVDSHVHTGFLNTYFTSETTSGELLRRMDSLSIQFAINLGDMRSLVHGPSGNLEEMRRSYEESEGRLFYFGVFDPRNVRESLKSLEKACSRKGFKGIKLHPPFHRTPAEDPAYEHAWKLASEAKLTIVAHSWSVSSYNPAQSLSTPERYEHSIAKHQDVRFVLAHSGGRGMGQLEAIRLTSSYKNVYLDCTGDASPFYFETMAASVEDSRVLFGSDWPWMDPRAQLCRVYLSEIDHRLKRKILRDNALRVFGIQGDRVE